MWSETHYYCSKCGARFDNEDKCLKHEEKHQPKEHYEIVGIRYEEYATEKADPTMIYVKNSDGITLAYRRD